MLTPLSASMHALTWAASAPLTPWVASIDAMADFVAVVLHDTPVNTRKNERMTSRNSNGLTRRAPGSPTIDVGLRRPFGVEVSADSIAGVLAHASQCIGTPILARDNRSSEGA